MNPNIDSKEIKTALNAICKHHLFVNSSVYTRLLTYLVDKAINEEDIKEFTIGADLFGKNYLDNKNDGTVRTYMYKLRKKLATYYSDHSTKHNVIFAIEKGQYNLSFISQKEFYQDKTKPEIRIPISRLKQFVVVLLVMFASIFAFKTYQNHTPTIWKSYMKKGADNLLIISDQYMLMATNEFGEKHATMYRQINSDKDLFQFKKENPNRKIENTDFTLMSKMAPYATKRLDEWFMDNNSNFGLQLESKLSYDEIRDNNIVFVGQFKTMSTSSSLFLKNSKIFSIYDDGFKCSKNQKEIIYNSYLTSAKKVEYAMVSYTSFHPDKKALYFVSNNDVGVMATLRNFTDSEFLENFYKKLPHPSAHFNALFKVEGIDRTDLSCELVELELVE